MNYIVSKIGSEYAVIETVSDYMELYTKSIELFRGPLTDCKSYIELRNMGISVV